jgi:hypothetical protein
MGNREWQMHGTARKLVSGKKEVTLRTTELADNWEDTHNSCSSIVKN